MVWWLAWDDHRSAVVEVQDGDAGTRGSPSLSANSATAANPGRQSLLLERAHHAVEVARLSLGVAFELARLALLGGFLGGPAALLLAVVEIGLPLVVEGADELRRDLQLLDNLA